MSERLFPSGPWTGFYNYGPPDKHRMDLHLVFAEGRIHGDGNDDVGRFLIQGRYSEAERECHWTKTYSGSHDVHYRGFREGKGIWGAWEIGLFARGGFHIWPKGLAEGETEARQAEAEMPTEAVGVVEESDKTRPVPIGLPRPVAQAAALWKITVPAFRGRAGKFTCPRVR